MGRGKLFTWTVFFLIITGLGHLAYADQYFHPHRVDRTMPQHCFDMNLEYFDGPFADITVGIQGATERGFTHEIPIRRDQANALWHAFKAKAHGTFHTAAENHLRRDPSMEPYYRIIEANYRAMGFNFNSEGEILELLALVALRSNFPPEKYFHTGGYGYFLNHREVGELDIIVGERSSCHVVVVGQAKLGLKNSRAAWEQIQRFKNFLKNLLGRAMGWGWNSAY